MGMGGYMASHLKRLRKHHEEGDEWAVSFADMMTLLMCFFILMVSISAVDAGRYKQVAESLGIAMKTTPRDSTRPELAALTDRQALLQEQEKQQAQSQPQGQDAMRQAVVPPSMVSPVSPVPSVPPVAPVAPVAPGETVDSQSMSQVQAQQSGAESPVSPASAPNNTQADYSGGPTLDAVMGGLEERLRDAGSAVQVERRSKSIAIRLHGPVFFGLASSEITEASLPFLQRVAEEVRDTRFHLTVEGHTDDLPITSDKFPSNWELSSARAAAVARYLINNGAGESRVEVRGYAHVRPLVPNLDEHGSPIPENRVLNRRVVIVVSASEVPSDGL